MHPTEPIKDMRTTLQNAGITASPSRLGLYLGGTVVSSAVGSALLNVLHRTPGWLLIVFFGLSGPSGGELGVALPRKRLLSLGFVVV